MLKELKKVLTKEELITELKIEVYYYRQYLHTLFNYNHKAVQAHLEAILPPHTMDLDDDFWKEYLYDVQAPPNPKNVFHRQHLVAYFTRRGVGIIKQAKLLKLSNSTITQIQKEPITRPYSIMANEFELLKVVDHWEQLKTNLKADGYTFFELPKK